MTAQEWAARIVAESAEFGDLPNVHQLTRELVRQSLAKFRGAARVSRSLGISPRTVRSWGIKARRR